MISILPNSLVPPVPTAGGTAPLLSMRGISKRFPGVVALDHVDLDVYAGELHVLFGENGAGKSTLINILAGTFAPSGGHFQFDGADMVALTPQRARDIGIKPVFQEFSLAPNLSVDENIFLGKELTSGGFLNRGRMRQRAYALMEELGFEIEPSRCVGTMSRAHQQMVEIAKALLDDARLLILDEPTASLTERETGRLFQLIAKLKAQGVGIIYVSHRMREIRALADRITVLRDGLLVATVDAGAVSDSELIELMTGRKIDVLYPKIAHRPREVTLEIRNLCLDDGAVTDANFVARAGEVTGIAGLIGCGKSELIRAVYGLEVISSGKVWVAGALYDAPTPARSLDRGIAYFPADRVGEGLALGRTILENVSIAALSHKPFSSYGLVNVSTERSTVRTLMNRLNLKPPHIDRNAAILSGGNRQKVMLGRALTRDLNIFLFDEPTVGIDVGAKLEVYAFMKELAEAGSTVIVVSSDLPEAINLCNRLYVMHRGTVVDEMSGVDMTEQKVIASFFNQYLAKRDA